MTAAEATGIVASNAAADYSKQVGAILGRWHEAIGTAAAAGRVQAFGRDAGPILLTLSHAHDAALDRLRADGYTVESTGDGEAVVSWPAPPAVGDSPTAPTTG